MRHWKLAAFVFTAAVLATACNDKSSPDDGGAIVASDLVIEDGKLLAECGAQSGQAYYPAAGLTVEKDSGWTKDQISGGGTILVERPDGTLDVRWLDATRKIYSATAEGGIVSVHRREPEEITVLVSYPSDTFEIYQFIQTDSGALVMLQLQSKGGIIPKAGVLVARCSAMNFTSVAADPIGTR